MLLLTIIFTALLFIGVPISFTIGIVAAIGIFQLHQIPVITVVQKMFSGLNSFVLLAVPLFILAANLMNQGKISEKLIDYSISLVGHIRGGLAHANVVVSMIFAGISGSSQADTAGIGKVLIPSMIKQGYSKEVTVGVTAASSTIGIIIPPSIPMVIYGSIANASVGALFLGGIVPGILIGLGQMAVVYFFAVKNNYPKYPRASLKKIVFQTLESFPTLLTPIIIISGIVSGVATPTESACVACIYATVLGLFVFKTLKLKDLPAILIDTLKLSSLSLFALATANALGQLLSYYKVADQVQLFFTNFVPSKDIFLISTIALFLFLGTFMDAIPAMILFVPVLLPAAQSLGISSVHLGLIVVITLAIGQVTPPYGLCLLLASSIAGLSVERSFIGVIPFISVTLIVLLIISFFPDIAFFIPRLIMPNWL